MFSFYSYRFDDVTATDGSCLMEIKPNSEIKGQDGLSVSNFHECFSSLDIVTVTNDFGGEKRI